MATLVLGLTVLPGCENLATSCASYELSIVQGTSIQHTVACQFTSKLGEGAPTDANGSVDTPWNRGASLTFPSQAILRQAGISVVANNRDQVTLLAAPDAKPQLIEIEYYLSVDGVEGERAKIKLQVTPPSASMPILSLEDAAGTSLSVQGEEGQNRRCETAGCSFSIPLGRQVILDASAGTDKTCTWKCDTTTYTTCQASFRMTSDMTCRLDARVMNMERLQIATEGSGTVSVMDGATPITCQEGECFGARDSLLTLQASPNARSRFSGWFGDCSGDQLETTLLLDAPKTCTARFDFTPKIEVVIDATSDPGFTVKAPDVNLECTDRCEAFVEAGTPVGLTVSPLGGDTSRSFNVQWSGDCQGNTASVQVMVDSDKTCTVRATEILDCGTGQPPVAAVRVSSVPPGQSQGTEISPTTVSNGLKFSGFSNTDQLLLESTSTADAGRVITSVEWTLNGATFRGPVVEWVHRILPNGTANGTVTVTDSCNDSTTLNLVFEAGAH